MGASTSRFLAQDEDVGAPDPFETDPAVAAA